MKNKNELQYEMIKPKRQGKLKLDTKEVRIVQKTKLRQELKRQRTSQKRFRRILYLIIAAAIVIYIAGTVYYSKHFYSKGTAFGIALRNESVASVKKKIEEKMNAYTLTVSTRDGEETINASDIGLKYDDKKELDELFENEKPFLWFLMAATSEKEIDLDISVDEQKLDDEIRNLSCMQDENMTTPTDAHLEYSDGEFRIVDETHGNQLDVNKTEQVLEDAVNEGASEVSLDDQDCYVKPGVYKDDEKLKQECEDANKMLVAEITYDFGDRTEVVDSSVIADWITFGDDYTFDLDEDKITEYVHQLGLKYDTFGLSRQFKTHDGQTITLKGGDYGWCINKKKTVAQLKELVLQGAKETVEPVYLYSGVCRDTNDLGSTYIEVSTAAQTMWLYKDGECIVSTPVVTGNVSAGHSTPSGGVWAIDARMTNYTLKGQDYNSEVSFWLPFNGDVGIHDASWRSEFGGSIYKTRGSHGCVNTPYSAMKTIYENVKIGYPVVVY